MGKAAHARILGGQCALMLQWLIVGAGHTYADNLPMHLTASTAWTPPSTPHILQEACSLARKAPCGSLFADPWPMAPVDAWRSGASAFLSFTLYSGQVMPVGDVVVADQAFSPLPIDASPQVGRKSNLIFSVERVELLSVAGVSHDRSFMSERHSLRSGATPLGEMLPDGSPHNDSLVPTTAPWAVAEIETWDAFHALLSPWGVADPTSFSSWGEVDGKLVSSAQLAPLQSFSPPMLR